MKSLLALFSVLYFVFVISTFAQLTVKDQETEPNILLQVNDEGSIGSITLPHGTSSISTFTNKLYNLNGTLYWSGGAVQTGQGTSASCINDLCDGKTDNSSYFLGATAGFGDDGTDNKNIGIGRSALHNNVSGIQNTAIGYEALSISTGWYNCAIGYHSLYQNSSGSNNISIGNQTMSRNETGRENIAIGGMTLEKITDGIGNTAVGYLAFPTYNGSYNTVLGHQAGTNSSGNGNVFIGYQAGYAVTGGNKLFINNSTGAWPLIWGDFSTQKLRIASNESVGGDYRFYVNGSAGGATAWNSASDIRLKKNVTTLENSLSKVKKLRGVNFEWDEAENHQEGMQMGFIAQEVQEVIPELVGDSGEYLTMQYAPITALLVEAIKEQQNIIDDLRSELAEVKKEINELN